MARKTAGYRYPHATTDARDHEHTWCSITDSIAGRVADGSEEWGTPHHMPPLDNEQQAHRIRNKIFNSRNCPHLTRAHGQLSVSVMYLTRDGKYTNTRTPAGAGYVLVVRVFTRKMGQRAIIGRVGNGERLTYNAFRGN